MQELLAQSGIEQMREPNARFRNCSRKIGVFVAT